MRLTFYLFFLKICIIPPFLWNTLLLKRILHISCVILLAKDLFRLTPNYVQEYQQRAWRTLVPRIPYEFLKITSQLRGAKCVSKTCVDRVFSFLYSSHSTQVRAAFPSIRTRVVDAFNTSVVQCIHLSTLNCWVSYSVESAWVENLLNPIRELL